ncbi:hypothetical protein VNO77_44037 [Canavalia gladiata]|uniref:Uncharacterized protein n=1 Tax=Canavalia gladiata TaxID=3824 RepID=A0AAN9JVX3_CANGL
MKTNTYQESHYRTETILTWITQISNDANLCSTESDLQRTSLSLMQWNIEAPMSTRISSLSKRPFPLLLAFFNLFLRKSSPVPDGLESKDRDPLSFLLLPLDQKDPLAKTSLPLSFFFFVR